MTRKIEIGGRTGYLSVTGGREMSDAATTKPVNGTDTRRVPEPDIPYKPEPVTWRTGPRASY